MPVNGVFVTQKELEEITEQEREIAWRSKRLEELRSDVHILLSGGATVEPGRFWATLKKRIGRSIPWRQCVIDNLGYEFAERFRKQCPANVFFEVAVVEHAVPPLWRGFGEGTGSGN